MYPAVFRCISDVSRCARRETIGYIEIQHVRCEYKCILAHEGGIALGYKIPSRYDTGYNKIQKNRGISIRILQYPIPQSLLANTTIGPSQPSSAHTCPSPTPAMRRRSACWPLGGRASRAGAMRRIRRRYEIFFVFQPYLEVSCATCGDTDERMYPVVSCRIAEYPRGVRVGPCVRVWIRVS